LTDEEIAQLLAELEKLLSDLGLDFIVAQERVLAAEGESRTPTEIVRGESEGSRQFAETLQVGSRPSAAPDIGRRWEVPAGSTQMPRFKNSDTVVIPLAPRDRLAFLFDLIEVATAGTIAMERDVHGQLGELRRMIIARSASPLEAETPQTWDGTVIFTNPPEAELRNQMLSSWKLATVEVLTTGTASAQTVIELLDDLRAQAGLSRGPWLAPHGDDAWNLAGRRHD
jgi:hypothetical protein